MDDLRVALQELHVQGTGVAFQQCLQWYPTDAPIVFSRCLQRFLDNVDSPYGIYLLVGERGLFGSFCRVLTLPLKGLRMR